VTLKKSKFWIGLLAAACFLLPAALGQAQSSGLSDRKASPPTVAVGPQYDTTHVYVTPGDMNAFVKSFLATFGGSATQRSTSTVTPVPSSTELQALRTPVGNLSVFGFTTAIPFPFGEERTGSLVTNMDDGIEAARAAGAEVIVEPFKDPIGIDAVIAWPGGVKMQLYWHFKASTSPPLETVPDNRVYVSPDEADRFVRSFIGFSGGKIVKDDRHADAGEIGRRGETYRSIRLSSLFGNMQVLVTDGHLPYPFGRELTGYEVGDLDATLAKATASGAKILSPVYAAGDRSTAMIEFPGGYIAEVHSGTGSGTAREPK
jgi:predicted enzyme related to lactoylglutathione lyase